MAGRIWAQPRLSPRLSEIKSSQQPLDAALIPRNTSTRRVSVSVCLSTANMQSSLESSGFFETFNSDADDFDLEDDDFPTGTMSFNGRLVISGGPNVFPVLETGGKLLICAQCLYCIRTTIMVFSLVITTFFVGNTLNLNQILLLKYNFQQLHRLMPSLASVKAERRNFQLRKVFPVVAYLYPLVTYRVVYIELIPKSLKILK